MKKKAVPICDYCSKDLLFFGQIACIACGKVQKGYRKGK